MSDPAEMWVLESDWDVESGSPLNVVDVAGRVVARVDPAYPEAAEVARLISVSQKLREFVQESHWVTNVDVLGLLLWIRKGIARKEAKS